MLALQISSRTCRPPAGPSSSGSRAGSCRGWQRSPVTECWPEAVVFDLDGTLIDSAGDIADALNAALRQSRVEPFPEDEVRLMVGGGTRVLIERALEARGLSSDTALAQQIYAAYMEIFRTASVARTTVHEHAVELLAEL